VAEDQVELLRAVVVQAIDAVVIMETDREAGTNRIVYVNPAMEQLIGYSATEMIGQPAKSFARHDVNGGLSGLASAMVTREDHTASTELQITDAQGNLLWVEVRSALVQRLSDTTHSWVLLMRDIGERRRAQAELMRARDAAEAASRAKDEFLANMSHEIRTPMNGVLGMTELLLETRLSGEQRRYGEAVRQSGETLLTILNDILDISKLEAGKVELEVIDFDLVEMVESAATLLASRGREKGLDIGVFIDPAAHRIFRGDPTRVRQILLNLIGNGVKFTERGAVSIEVSMAAGGPDGAADPVRLRFEVKDTGIGIPEEIRRRLFDKFSQADSSITRRYGGTGLGLAICRQLVELMGGEIGVHSVPGVGSTFWFELPLAVSDTPVADYDTLLPQLRGLRVLAVDDIEMNLDIIARHLGGLGMEVTCCRDPFDAMAELERAWHRGRPYSVVFLDQMMPGLSGEGLAQRLRASPDLATTKLILVSSAGAHGTASPQLLDAVLEKPLRRRELVRALAGLRGAGPPAEQVWAAPSGRPAPGARRLRILLAEDNPINQQFVRAVLDKAGHQVTVAADGVAAVEAVRDGDFDLVLMDVQMPDLDGVGATRRIRTLPPPKSAIPIVALTANAMSGAAEQYLAAGMDDYVSKPIKPATLLAKIEQHAGMPRPTLAPRPVATADPADDRILDEEALAMLVDVMSPVEIRELIGGFLTDARSRVTRIGELSVRGDLSAAAREAHILVSTTGTVGAKRVSELAQSLELACKAADRAAAGRLAPDLEAAFARAAAALGRWQTQLLQLH
jgi:PAS domain S-box-containing protein